jgi:hypothetical protein
MPSTPTSSHRETPMRFGRALPRWAKMPTRGQSIRSRGWRADVSIVRRVDAVHQEDDFEVRELVDSEQGVRAEARIDLDDAFDASPEIVGRLDHAASAGSRRAEGGWPATSSPSPCP